MTIVPVTLGERSYEVAIEPGALARAETHLRRFARDGRLIVVTDENVVASGHTIAVDLLDVSQVILPAGETTKSWRMLEHLTDRLLELGVERSDTIIAFGGGVIGDLVGFACAILKRGCGFVQVPTTLLAQVDSSVGGKTAINTRAGKNLVGTFHQPSHVLIDPDTLDTLPRRELGAGYAEVAKYGLIDDPVFFSWCETHSEALLAGNRDARVHAIATSIAAKARIVAADERETTGIRALLNLGHTFGHALEAETGFSDRLLHGEGVACGMALAFRFSAKLGLCSSDDAERVSRHLAAAGLPATLAAAGVDASGETLIAHMLHDKKMAGGKLPFLLAHGIGRTFLAKDVDLADVTRFLDEDQNRDR
jgi:3-dehydroquinate synthase